MREIFEQWCVVQFGAHMKALLVDFDEEDGYVDQYINGIWLGFNGGCSCADAVYIAEQ